MKNTILSIATIFLLFSCSSKTDKQIKTKTIRDSNESSQIKIDTTTEMSLVMNNPSVFLGTDFITFFQTCYTFAEFDKMINFTSSKSVEQHGRERIFKLYKTMDLKYQMKLVYMVKIDKEYHLTYETNKMATKGIKRFIIAIENDSCKIVLPDNLNEF